MTVRNDQTFDFFKRLLAVAGFVTAIAGAVEVIFPSLPARFIAPVVAVIGGAGLTAYLAQRSRWQISEIIGIWAIIGVLLLTIYLLPTTVQGTVIRPDGMPASGVDVTLIDANGVDHTDLTDADGGYVIRGVPDGEYTLTSEGQILYRGVILGRLQRVISLYTVEAGSVAVGIAGPEPTLAAMQAPTSEPPTLETPAPEPSTAPADPAPTLNIQPTAQSGCNDPIVCTIFPVADASGAAEFNWYHEPGELIYEHTAECAYGDDPSGVRIRYGFTGEGNGGWGIHWSQTEARYYDASAYNLLQFRVKGAQGGERFDLGLKDDTGEVKITVNADADPAVIPAEWIQISIPLADFASIDLSAIENMSFGFSRIHGAGEVCIDEIEFAR